MPRNGSGGYLPPQNSWNPAINGAQALPNDWMAILNDIAATLQASTAADGQTPITGVWNFGNNRISNVGAPTGQGNALRWEQLIKGPDIESAGTISIPVEGQLFDVTGTTTITTINDTYPGRVAMLRFGDELQLNNSANLQLPDGADIETLAGDIGIFVNVDTGVWRCVSWPASTYRRSNIIGPVSKNDDLPTGAVIEKGEPTANSAYVKFADGSLFMTIRDIFHTTSAANTWNTINIAAPAAFLNNGTCIAVATIQNIPSGQSISVRALPLGTSQVTLSVLSATSAIPELRIQLFMKGLWA
ncbi:hypothetical protein RE432_18280 [Pusillimonas sp. SM2304]|uniref:hypothetical protein n=1 Tax=Pusillimonas sp. SM2304 TaxID=3073241 RepID=UPI002875E72F|nr:hypothetical protein [Pusillimonas sp. SM2304]MDS1142385.1 hypothetical protein [Pusillimonas sp. SM2304]